MDYIISTTMSTAFKTIGDFFIKKVINGIEKENENKNENIRVAEMMSRYLQSRYDFFYNCHPIALKKSVPLKEIYIPLTLEEPGIKRYKIEKFSFEIFTKKNSVLIQDDAGMGKSTLLKWMFLTYIQQCEEKQEYDFFPIFIEIRNFERKNSYFDLIKNNFISREKIQDRDIEILLKSKIIFFLDGFDEISIENKEKAMNEINKLTTLYPENLYILSSRKEQSLSNFSNYSDFRICPLKIEEAKELLKKYMYTNENGAEGSVGDRIEKRYEELISQLNDSKNLQTFLKNSLLTSLLYRTFSYRASLPISKVDFYDQVFDALYNEHDLNSKGLFTRKISITKNELKKVLKRFSLSNIKNLEIRYNEDDFFNKILDAQEKSKVNCRTLDLILDLCNAVPLFKKENNEYIWCHKSMQDYFISNALSELGIKEKFISSLINSKQSENYIEIFDFLYEKDKLMERIVFEILTKEIEKMKKENLENLENLENMFVYNYICIIKVNAKDIDFRNISSFNGVKELLRDDIMIYDRKSIVSSKEYSFIIAVKYKKNIYTLCNLLQRKKINIFKDKRLNINANESAKKISLNEVHENYKILNEFPEIFHIFINKFNLLKDKNYICDFSKIRDYNQKIEIKIQEEDENLVNLLGEIECI